MTKHIQISGFKSKDARSSFRNTQQEVSRTDVYHLHSFLPSPDQLPQNPISSPIWIQESQSRSFLWVEGLWWKPEWERSASRKDAGYYTTLSSKFSIPYTEMNYVHRIGKSPEWTSKAVSRRKRLSERRFFLFLEIFLSLDTHTHIHRSLFNALLNKMNTKQR